ncbi:hypothetical protein [Nocardia sp. R6R-6]|uniref:hypothetical protein n=1 Tax=Nocardia sp. R6R-6 TaxID=3459303 RepID=UPI00403D61E6
MELYVLPAEALVEWPVTSLREAKRGTVRRRRLDSGGLAMTEARIDYGQAEIAAFNQAASAGAIRYEEGAVQEAVALYERMINELIVVRDRLREAAQGTSFGGFDSAQQLRNGFSNKAVSGIDAVNQLIEGAMRLQEAYLRAGGLIADADQRNADALRFAAQNAGLDETNA